MIEVLDLTKFYGPKLAIQNVRFSVNKGEIVGLLGPNGAGKTTTMRILTGYMPPTSGDARIGNISIWDNELELKRQIGYLPENPPLYPDMTVKDYLAFVADLKAIPISGKQSTIADVIEKTNIGDVQNRVIGVLSKGYRQRVGLAQALLGNPDVLILDEPTVGLDPKQIIEIRTLIKNLAGEHTIILSTHILPEVEMTCQRVIIIDKGKVIAEDSVEHLTLRLQGTFRINLEVQGPESKIHPILDQFDSILAKELIRQNNDSWKITLETRQDIRSELAKKLVSEGLNLTELSRERFSLEEAFLHLITQEEVQA